MEQDSLFLSTLILDHQPLPDVHLTNVAVQKTSPDYHPKKVSKLGSCPQAQPLGQLGWWVRVPESPAQACLGLIVHSAARSTLPICRAQGKRTNGGPCIVSRYLSYKPN